MIKSLLTEYKPGWLIDRSLYAFKLKLLCKLPKTEALFEHAVHIKRIDLFRFDGQALRAFLKALPKGKTEEILSVADQAVSGKIFAFSSMMLDYQDPIDWHYNPQTGQRTAADKKWYTIPDFDPKTGDIKVVWEASRFTHFWYFIRAFLLTEDQKYYQAFSTQLDAWLEKNPYPFGANFKCGQECSLRMINALAAFCVFADAGLCTSKDCENLKELVTRCYKKVRSNFFYAHRCIQNNHTFSEICGLIVGAWCEENDKMLQKAFGLLEKEIQKQFYQDGGYKQFSFNYQRFTFQILECALYIAKKCGITLSQAAKTRIQNSVQLMYQCQAPNGDVPNYGSNDGALIFPLSVCDYRDFRPAMNGLYHQLCGKHLYPDPGDYREETLWFSDSGGGADAEEQKSTAFEVSGFFTLRQDDVFAMLCLQNFQNRPSHMDQLHLDVWKGDVNIFCDSGTYSYASELGTQLSATYGHNTAYAGVEQMNKHGAFMVNDWTKRTDVTASKTTFSGRFVSQNGYAHRRSVYLDTNSISVTDTIENAQTAEILWHTPLDCEIEGSLVRLKNTDGEVLAQLVCGENQAISLEKAKRSLYYLKTEEINCIRVTAPAGKSVITIRF